MAKPRVIISTDIGGADNDDMQSMAHALLASDQWDLKALVSTPTGHDGRTTDIHTAIDAYAADYANLKTWSSAYKTPDQLKSITHQGSINVAPSSGYSGATAGSTAIVNAARDAKAGGEPLWVMTWGALTDVAQALHDDPSLVSTIRVLASNGWNWKQDPNAYDYVIDTHVKNGLWMIDSKSTHRGIYIDLNGNQNNAFDLNKVKYAGALGDYFYDAMPWGVKMGDSWSIAYLTDQADNSNPWADSWGGQFVKNGKGPNYYTDDPNPAYSIAGYAGAAHVREHQSHIYNDMYKLFARAKAPNANGTADSGIGSGNPVTAVDDTYRIDPGKALWFNARYLAMNDKGPDGDLQVVGISGTTAFGVRMSMASDGTIIYHAPIGWQGTDSMTYTVRDADGSTDMAKVYFQVGHGGDPLPTSGGTSGGDTGGETGSGTGSGSGNPVTAVDDNYKVDPGKQLWFNARYLTTNDKGLDGGLKVTGIGGTTAFGVKVSLAADGTIVYRAPIGWQGIDRLTYTVADADGSTDTGAVLIKVGHGGDALPSGGNTAGDDTTSGGSDETTTGGSGGDSGTGTGTGNPVVAVDDNYQTSAGQTLWVNAGYFKWNDKGLDGGLTVTGIGSTTAAGVAVGMESNGTIVYRPLAGWQGTDRLTYTVRDVDGSTDTGTVFIKVGHGGDAIPAPSGDAADGRSPAAGVPKILALGDSHTYGIISTSFDRESGGYRPFLAEKLDAAGVPVDFVGSQESGSSTFDNDHEGYPGIQIDGLTTKVPAMLSATQPDYILLLAGNNDAVSDSVSTMTAQMGQLIDTLGQHAPDAQILVAGILPCLPDNVVGMDPAKIAGFNAALPGLVASKAAAGARVSFVDTSSVGLGDMSGLDVDKGVHLTSAGHQKLAEIWFQALKSAGVAGDGGATTEPSSDEGGKTGSAGDGVAGAPAAAGSGNPVSAKDDSYAVDAGQSLWFNSRYLTHNDSGADGGLHVVAVDSTSKAGAKVSWNLDGFASGTTVYKPLAGWQGVDTVSYTVADADGSLDTALIHIDVGAGDLLIS